jgi:AmmeMemoRadiSam system protein A
MNTTPAPLTATDRAQLLELARRAIAAFITTGHAPSVDSDSLGERLRQPGACFVTLTKQGTLRGCIGNVTARDPLWQSVMHNAIGAAFRDTRFATLDGSELPDLHIEISVLSAPHAVNAHSPEELLTRLRPSVDGILLKAGGRAATYLPQVWEKLPDAESFLESLTHKAGLPSGAWRDPDASVLTYQVEAFAEPANDSSLSSR